MLTKWDGRLPGSRARPDLLAFRQHRDPFQREADPMHAIYVDVLLVVGAIVAIGLLTMSELAVGAASKSRLRSWSDRGDRAAAAALGLSEHPKRLLWTVQAGTALLATLAGVHGGATLAPPLGRAIERIGPLAPYHQSIGLFCVILAITLTSLVVGNLVPGASAFSVRNEIARDLNLPDSRSGDCGHADRRVLERGDRSSRCGRSVFVPAHEPPIARKRSRCCCRKAPKQVCSRPASTK